MASMKLWGVLSVFLMLIGDNASETMDLPPRQMLFAPSFIRQAASPVFFAAGPDSPRQHFRPTMFDALSDEEDIPNRPFHRLQQVNGLVHRQPFDIHAAAATPERRPFLAPLNPLRSVPPPFFIEDDVSFPSVFKVPPRHFQQSDSQDSPQHFRPKTNTAARHPTRHDDQSSHRIRPSSSAPQRNPTITLSESSEETFQREVGPSARRPTGSSEENFQHKARQSTRRPTTTPPWSSGKIFRQENRPTTTLPRSSEENFRQNTRPTSRRPTVLPQSSEEAFRQRIHPTTKHSTPQQHPITTFPQSSSEETFRQGGRPLTSHILPSVLDSLHESRVPVFIPGEAGKDYPLFAHTPQTGFSCTEDMISNFVADEETRCQVVRVCREDGGVDNFLCPNGTLFDNDSQFCNWWYRVPCGENGNSNQIPHRGRTISQVERENRLRQRPEIDTRPHLRHPTNDGRDQNKRPIDHGLDGFFSAFPQSQENHDFSGGNLDDFFGQPKLAGFQPQTESHEMRVQTPEEARPLSPPVTTFTGTTQPSQVTKRPLLKHRTRKPSPTRAPKVEQGSFATIQSDVGSILGPTEEDGLTKRPTQKQSTRRPSSSRAPKVLHENIENVHEDLGSTSGFERAEEGGRLPTRSPIANVRTRGRVTFKPRSQRIQTTHQTGQKDEFDPFYDEQSQDLETTTITNSPTTPKRKLNARRTTTKRPSTRKTTTRKTTKLTPSTIRFRHRSTKKPGRILTARPSSTTTEEAIVSKDSKISSVTTPVSEVERPLPRKHDVEPFTHDPFKSFSSEIHSSPFNPQTPVNFDPFNFGPMVTGNFQRSVMLDELPIVVTLPEDTVASRPEDIPITTTTTVKTPVASTPTRLRSSPKRRGKGSIRNLVSTSTFVSARKSTTAASTLEITSTLKSRNAGRSRSKWRTRKTNATAAESDQIPTSTVRVFATPRSREQLFPTRPSLMKKTGFGQKQVEITTVVNETVEEAQESNKIAVAETTPVVVLTTEDNNGTTVTG